MWLHGIQPLLLALPFLHRAAAYIPAQPVNDTSSLDQSQDEITIAFYNGVYAAPLSRQLTAWSFDDAGNYTNVSDIVSWTKYSKGVLIHFDEASREQPPSAVPWIAMINCDTNGTDYSLEDDIFTLTRDQGAQAALLYSLTSQGCLMNEEYLNDFEKVLDVYATTTISASRIIEQQFSHEGISSDAYSYNSQLLNDSAAGIQALLDSNALSVNGNVYINATDNSTDTASSDAVSTILPTAYSTNSSSTTSASASRTSPTSSGGMRKRQTTSTSSAVASAATSGTNYLGAVMAARNNTVGGLLPSSATPSPSQTSSGGGGPNTGLAMIILYAITGVVTFMFLIVILSGAIRAIRHPERYGPRAGIGGPHGANINGGGARQQSRAHGLTRAILDTFPVVKFGGRTADDRADDDEEARRRDVAAGKDVEMDDIEATKASSRTVAGVPIVGGGEIERRRSDSSRSGADNASFVSAAEIPLSDTDVASSPTPASPETAPAALPLTINPADVDHGTTCPICVCEFEEGEDVRILPCDGRHRFHRDCIDPWLLEVSSLCPLCRLDLSGATAAAAAARERADEDETEEIETGHAEAQVISNLRAMLHGHRASVSSGSGHGHGRESTTGTNASGVSRNRFFRYVANRRRQRNQDGPAEEEAPAAGTSGSRRS
ncbi:hypothetical protein BCR35DRAFT_324024 [Leucosporidium creatinivorum]|uniref:RING-type domain-containing protein n=1 Tax=Leucosporidium creatinivorum TaxID=106004 RepID=A0A1Y2G0M9_9BASI|nr:hypothetical protein BCR35DRAFT_324024 [Leucosporidium creatinivorum]